MQGTKQVGIITVQIFGVRTVHVPVGQFLNETDESRHHCVQSATFEKKGARTLLKKINNRRKKKGRSEFKENAEHIIEN